MVIKESLVGPPRFELGTSCTPSKRASQAAPRPDSSIVRQTAPPGGGAKVPGVCAKFVGGSCVFSFSGR